jgi:hypothetical protein
MAQDLSHLVEQPIARMLAAGRFLNALNRSKINARAASFWDCGYQVSIKDEPVEDASPTMMATEDEAVDWFRENILPPTEYEATSDSVDTWVEAAEWFAGRASDCLPTGNEQAESDARLIAAVQIMEDLYDSEINAKILWISGRGCQVALGDANNGFKGSARVNTWVGAAEWLRDKACDMYPRSSFAGIYAEAVRQRAARKTGS